MHRGGLVHPQAARQAPGRFLRPGPARSVQFLGAGAERPGGLFPAQVRRRLPAGRAVSCSSRVSCTWVAYRDVPGLLYSVRPSSSRRR